MTKTKPSPTVYGAQRRIAETKAKKEERNKKEWAKGGSPPDDTCGGTKPAENPAHPKMSGGALPAPEIPTSERPTSASGNMQPTSDSRGPKVSCTCDLCKKEYKQRLDSDRPRHCYVCSLRTQLAAAEAAQEMEKTIRTEATTGGAAPNSTAALETSEAKHRQEMTEMKAQVAALEAEAQAQKEHASASAAEAQAQRERASAAAALELREREALQRRQEAAEAQLHQQVAEMKAQMTALETKAQAQKESASAAAALELRERATMNVVGESATYEARPALSRSAAARAKTNAPGSTAAQEMAEMKTRVAALEMAEMKTRVAALEAEAQAQRERTSAATADELREREASQRWQEAAEAKHRQEMTEMKVQVATLEAEAQAQKERTSDVEARELQERARTNVSRILDLEQTEDRLRLLGWRRSDDSIDVEDEFLYRDAAEEKAYWARFNDLVEREILSLRHEAAIELLPKTALIRTRAPWNSMETSEIKAHVDAVEAKAQAQDERTSAAEVRELQERVRRQHGGAGDGPGGGRGDGSPGGGATPSAALEMGP